MPERDCGTCGSRFHAPAYKVAQGKAKYCGRPCYLEAVKPPPRSCVTCSAPIPQTAWSYEAKYCSQRCYRTDQPRPNFKGGKIVDKDGYTLVWSPDHSMARGHGYVAEHRIVAAEAVGRDLTPTEVVHHKNGDRADNRPENLHVCADQSEHMMIHALAQ